MAGSIVAARYLGTHAAQHRRADGPGSPRGALFNFDWVTLMVMVVIVLVGAVYFFVARPDRRLSAHLSDEMEQTGAERHPA